MSLPVTVTPGTIPDCYPASANDLCAECLQAALAVVSLSYPCIVSQDTTPAPDQQSCLWFDTTNGVWKRYFGGSWQVIPLERWFLSFFAAFYAVDTGVANAAVIANPNRTLAAYGAGLVFWVKMNASNTGATTLKVDALAARAVKKYTVNGITDLVQGDLVASGVYVFVDDGTQFILLNPTPAQIQSKVFDDGVTLDTRVKTEPTPSLKCEFTHGFTRNGTAVVPDVMQWVLVCQTGDAGFSAGDEVDVASVWAEDTVGGTVTPEQAFGTYRNATTVGCSPTFVPTGGTATFVLNSVGIENALTLSRWKLRCRAYLF